jgi:transcriptional regulator with PAS, ATPase and Fis domain
VIQVIGEKINRIFSEENILELLKINQNIEGKIFTIRDARIVANIIPIKINSDIVSYAITFQESFQIQRVEQKIRRKLYLKGNFAENICCDIIGESDNVVYIITMGKNIL